MEKSPKNGSSVREADVEQSRMRPEASAEFIEVKAGRNVASTPIEQANKDSEMDRVVFHARQRSADEINCSGLDPERKVNERQQSAPVYSSSASVAPTTVSRWHPRIIDFESLRASWVNSEADIFGSPTGFRSSLELESASNFFPDSMLSSMSSVRVDSASSIHDAARITDWDSVLELCASNPECAKFSGVDGWTALHHACNRRCPRPEVAEALIDAYPEALIAEEEKGWLPLHYACRFKAPWEVVRLLLYKYPELGKIAVSRKDRMGRTPLYYAVRYDAPPGVVGLLLEVEPAAVLEEDQNDDSPIALVWNSWADKMEGKRLVKSFLPGGFPEPEGVTEQERTRLLREKLRAHPKIHKRWEKVNMLLKAAFGFPVEEERLCTTRGSTSIGSERTWRILHAVSAVKCHLSLFLLACALHPEQAQELDESDLRRPSDPMLTGISTHQTALHLAASSNAGGEAGKTVIQDLLDLNRNAAHVQDAVDGSLPLHYIVENKYKKDWANFGSLLCHVYPRALQIPDHNGKLPLHRACAAITHSEQRGEDYMRTSVIMNVVRLFPQGASHVDNLGCLPFHILSMHAEEWDENVESVYNAHRAAIHARCGSSLDNRLPIHLTASNARASETLISRLVRLHPRAASVADRQGKLAFHLCCETGKDWECGTGAIYEAFSGAVEVAEGNSRGWLPLHMVAQCRDSSTALIEKLVELNQAAASVKDTRGRFALHLACAAGKKWDSGLETLFNAYPTSLATADDSGLLPLHIAALQSCRSNFCCEDNKRFNSSIRIGGDVAEMANDEGLQELENIYQLLRADPSVL